MYLVSASRHEFPCSTKGGQDDLNVLKHTVSSHFYGITEVINNGLMKMSASKAIFHCYTHFDWQEFSIVDMLLEKICNIIELLFRTTYSFCRVIYEFLNILCFSNLKENFLISVIQFNHYYTNVMALLIRCYAYFRAEVLQNILYFFQ